MDNARRHPNRELRWYEEGAAIRCYGHDTLAGIDKLRFRMAVWEDGIASLQIACMGDDSLRHRVDMRDSGGMRFARSCSITHVVSGV
jgi:hypothetical protein